MRRLLSRGVNDMISEHSAVEHIGTNAASRDWPFAMPHASLDGIVAFARGTVHSLKNLLPSLIVPSHALWEANMLVRMLSAGEPAEYRPDPFSTESPFVSDSWLGHI